MATLSVLKFNDPYGADRVLLALQGLQEREMINLEDAAVVSCLKATRSQPPASYRAPQAQVLWAERSGVFCLGSSSLCPSSGLRSGLGWAHSLGRWRTSESTTTSSSR